MVLGLAVDNTFHLAAAVRRAGPRVTPRTLLRACQGVGEAAWSSSLALAAGFATLGLSGFVPTAHFGLLVSVGALLALVADLAFLPALWSPSARGRRGPAR